MQASPLDERSSQLKRISCIIVGGFLIAVIFHAWQGICQGLPYPDNTFLFFPKVRFTDYSDIVNGSSSFAPYHEFGAYFPASYLLVYPLSWLPQAPMMAVLFGLCLTCLYIWLKSQFMSATGDSKLACIAAACLTLLSYPIIYALDRGNFELVLLACVLGFVHFFLRGRHGWALAFLIPAILVKLYPAALLAVYLRPFRWRLLLTAALACLLATIGSLFCYRDGPAKNLELMQRNMNNFNELYVVWDCGISGGAGPWNAIKLFSARTFIANAAEEGTKLTRPMYLDHIHSLLRAYSWCALSLCALVTFIVWKIETDPRRQLALLLLFMVFASPAAADYKLVHVLVALACVLGARELRPRDGIILTLLALALIPMKYVYMAPLMRADDIAPPGLNIIVTPLLLLASFTLLCLGSGSEWRNRRSSVNQLT